MDEPRIHTDRVALEDLFMTFKTVDCLPHHENGVQSSVEERSQPSQPVLQATEAGDCLEVGSRWDTDPAIQTDSRRYRYYLWSHLETGRTNDSVCNRPVAQQSPRHGGVMQT